MLVLEDGAIQKVEKSRVLRDPIFVMGLVREQLLRTVSL